MILIPAVGGRKFNTSSILLHYFTVHLRYLTLPIWLTAINCLSVLIVCVHIRPKCLSFDLLDCPALVLARCLRLLHHLVHSWLLHHHTPSFLVPACHLRPIVCAVFDSLLVGVVWVLRNCLVLHLGWWGLPTQPLPTRWLLRLLRHVPQSHCIRQHSLVVNCTLAGHYEVVGAVRLHWQLRVFLLDRFVSSFILLPVSLHDWTNALGWVGQACVWAWGAHMGHAVGSWLACIAFNLVLGSHWESLLSRINIRVQRSLRHILHNLKSTLTPNGRRHAHIFISLTWMFLVAGKPWKLKTGRGELNILLVKLLL